MDNRCPACLADSMLPVANMDDWLAYARNTTDDRRMIAKAVDETPVLKADMFVTCGKCGHYWLLPVPKIEALSQFYQQYFANGNYTSKAAKKVRRAAKRIGRLKGMVKGRRFLDVGFNVGCAVEASRLHGFDGTGIEIDAESVAQAKELFPENRFFQSTIEAFAAKGEQFDLIYSTEVIEHVPDPEGFTKALKALLAPGGMVFMTTPDSGHWRRTKPFLHWAEVKPPEHLAWFSKRSMKALLLRCGFSDVRFRFCSKAGLRVMAR